MKSFYLILISAIFAAFLFLSGLFLKSLWISYGSLVLLVGVGVLIFKLKKKES